MRIPTFVWVIALVFVAYPILNSRACNRRPDGMVGVGRSSVTSRIDLTDKLDPAILPDLVKEILREMTPGQKPESDKFQQELIRRLSQRIMDDPNVNYRVDLNEDQNMDPILVVPESVKGEAAVYSVRVPDPEKHPRDPEANADWGKIAETGIELCALSVRFDENAKKLVVDAETNEYVYQDSQRHYRAEYPAQQHSFLQTYMTFMIFRSVMFMPYMWYSPMWMGGWYGGYYGGWHGPVRARSARTSSRYRAAPRATGSMRTASGSSVRSSKASARSRPPAFVSSRQSRAAASRRSTPTRSTSRSSSRSFRGGSYGYGK